MSVANDRSGKNRPEAVIRGELALWLMFKEDGTAVGVPL